MITHTYITSTNFVTSVTFDSIETYSFQRGTAFEENEKLIRNEYFKLKVRKEKRQNLSPNEEVRLLELRGLLASTQYLINDQGQFHPSAKRTNTFKLNDPHIETIIYILKTEIQDIPQWMCAPIYRDAFVFRNGSEIKAVLNICLSCEYMETTMHNHILGDCKTYELFRNFFTGIGHEVEGPDEYQVTE